MFGDAYILKIGAATENIVGTALFGFLRSQYISKARVNQGYANSLAAAVTCRVFGSIPSGNINKAFANKNSAKIEKHARKLASERNEGDLLLVNLSGRGDKDLSRTEPRDSARW